MCSIFNSDKKWFIMIVTLKASLWFHERCRKDSILCFGCARQPIPAAQAKQTLQMWNTLPTLLAVMNELGRYEESWKIYGCIVRYRNRPKIKHSFDH